MHYPVAEQVPEVWMPGDVLLSTYHVQNAISSGGMATVYRVHHTHWDIDLAVKSPHLSSPVRSEVAELIVREAETWVQLGMHPHIVSCYYVRILGGSPRLFLELVEGGSLADWLRSGRLYRGSPDQVWRRILDIAIQSAWGLHYAHEQGLIHRDIKPSNILLTSDGVAKLTDFGISALRAHSAMQNAHPASADERRLMTPEYASPEQADAGELTLHTDIYSLGVTILEMIKGELQWQHGRAAPFVLKEHYGDAYGNDHLARLLARCFSPAELRPSSALRLADELMKVYRTWFDDEYPRRAPSDRDLLADGLNNRGVSLFDLGKEGEGEDALREALAKNPAHLEANYNLKLWEWRKGRITDEAAIRHLWSLWNTDNDQQVRRFIDGINTERGVCIPIAQFPRSADDILLLGQQTVDMLQTPPIFLDVIEGSNDSLAVAIDREGTFTWVGLSSGARSTWRSGQACDYAKCSVDGSMAYFAKQIGIDIEVFELHCIKQSVKCVLRISLSTLTGFDAFDENHIIIGTSCRLFLVSTADWRTVAASSLDDVLPAEWILEKASCPSRIVNSVTGVATVPGTSCVIVSSGNNRHLLRISQHDRRIHYRTSYSATRAFPAGSLAIHPAGHQFADADQGVFLWSFEGEKMLELRDDDKAFCNALCYSHSGEYLHAIATSGFNAAHYIVTFEVTSGRVVRTISLPAACDSQRLVCSRQESKLVVALASGVIQVIDDYSPSVGAAYAIAKPRSYAEINTAESEQDRKISRASQLVARGIFSEAFCILSEIDSIPEVVNRQSFKALEKALITHGIRTAIRAVILDCVFEPKDPEGWFFANQELSQVLWVQNRHFVNRPRFQDTLYDVDRKAQVACGEYLMGQLSAVGGRGLWLISNPNGFEAVTFVDCDRQFQATFPPARKQFQYLYSWCISRDWTRMLTATADEIAIWNITENTKVSALDYGDKQHRAFAAFSSDSRHFALKSSGSSLKMMSVGDMTVETVFQNPFPCGGESSFLCFSDHDSYLQHATCEWFESYDTKSGMRKSLGAFVGISALASVPHSDTYAIGYKTGNISFYSDHRHVQADRIPDSVHSIAFSPDARRMIVNGRYVFRILWDYHFIDDVADGRGQHDDADVD